MNAYQKCTKLTSTLVLLLTAAGAWAATPVQRDWRGRETALTAANPTAAQAAVVSPTSIILVDGSDSSRCSDRSLTMVLSSGTTRQFRATAYSSGASGTWYVDGKSVGTGTSLTYSVGLGTHKVECKSGSKSVSATATIIDGSKQPIPSVKYEFKDAKSLAFVLTYLNAAFGQSDNTIKWTAQYTPTWWNVDVKSSPLTAVSKNWTVGGGASMSYRAFIPGASITLPYCRAGLFVEPSLSLMMEFSADKIASTNLCTWKYSGGPKLSGAVAGGLGAYVGERNVIRIDADVRGSAGASGSGKLQGPPASVNLAYNIGKLTVGGQVKVYLLGQPMVTYSVSQPIWNGLSGQTTVPLASLIS